MLGSQPLRDQLPRSPPPGYSTGGSCSPAPLMPQACYGMTFALSESHLRPRVMQLHMHLKQIGL